MGHEATKESSVAVRLGRTDGYACAAHFRDRLLERFGIELNLEDEEFLFKQIEYGIAKILHTTNSERALDTVMYTLSLLRNGELIEFDAVYSLSKKLLVTVLPVNNHAREKAERFEERLSRHARNGGRKPKRNRR